MTRYWRKLKGGKPTPDELRFFGLDDENHLVPITLEQWSREFSGKNRIVEQTKVNDVNVSTVFLGLNHRHFGSGPPLVFETMIFGGPLDGYQWRYSSWDDAVTGHAVAVRKAQRG